MKKIIQSPLFKFIVSAGLAILFFVLCPPCFTKWKIGLVLALLVLIINAFRFLPQMASNIFTQLTRVFVGGLFIFSGFIKSNDPLGFSYKLEEYFEVFKTDTGWGFFEWFAHGSLTWAIIICVSEVALGFMLLIGFKRKLTLWLLLAQIVFFTFLTFYSACYNKVTHCGCFGDFIKFTPWQSFWKDLILLIAIAVLFVGKDHINPLFKRPALNWIITGIAVLFSVWFPLRAYNHLPPFDFRAYAPGLSICEGMKPGPKYKAPVYESHFLYRNLKTNEIKEFTDKNYPWQDTLNWTYHDALPAVIVSPEVDGPKISDFNVTDLEGNSITDSILGIKGYYYLLICYDLDKTASDATLQAQINDFYTLCQKDKIPFFAITSSNAEKINQHKHKFNALYDFANADGIVLKTMIRSNPGLMLMKDCKVVTNWHHHDWPAYSEVKQEWMK